MACSTQTIATKANIHVGVVLHDQGNCANQWLVIGIKRPSPINPGGGWVVANMVQGTEWHPFVHPRGGDPIGLAPFTGMTITLTPADLKKSYHLKESA
jgi:hypothetical protein